MYDDIANPTNNQLQDLFVVDDEYLNNWETLNSVGIKVQDLWEDFIRVARRTIREDKALQGNRANNFALFIDVADDVIKMTIEESITDVAKEMSEYISGIDDADEKLYG